MLPDPTQITSTTGNLNVFDHISDINPHNQITCRLESNYILQNYALHFVLYVLNSELQLLPSQTTSTTLSAHQNTTLSHYQFDYISIPFTIRFDNYKIKIPALFSYISIGDVVQFAQIEEPMLTEFEIKFLRILVAFKTQFYTNYCVIK